MFSASHKVGITSASFSILFTLSGEGEKLMLPAWALGIFMVFIIANDGADRFHFAVGMGTVRTNKIRMGEDRAQPGTG